MGTIFQPLVTYEMPPTYFATDKLTSSFQEIVDAYGIARYREANPAVRIPTTLVLYPCSAHPGSSLCHVCASSRLLEEQIQAYTCRGLTHMTTLARMKKGSRRGLSCGSQR